MTAVASDLADSTPDEVPTYLIGSANRRRDAHETMAAGLPQRAIPRLHRFGYTIDELALITGVSSRTVNRLLAMEQTAKLDAPVSDRIYRVRRINVLASKLLGDETRAHQWLTSPLLTFGGKAPVSLLASSVGADQVVEALYAVAFGGEA